MLIFLLSLVRGLRMVIGFYCKLARTMDFIPKEGLHEPLSKPTGELQIILACLFGPHEKFEFSIPWWLGGKAAINIRDRGSYQGWT